MSERRWPDDWAERMAGKDCLLCASLGQGDNQPSDVLTAQAADLRALLSK